LTTDHALIAFRRALKWEDFVIDRTPVNALNAIVCRESIEVPEYHPSSAPSAKQPPSVHRERIGRADHEQGSVDREAALYGVRHLRAGYRRQDDLGPAELRRELHPEMAKPSEPQ
jgi:hypothetical protein